MILPYLFWALVILCLGYAALFGSRDGRIMATMLVGAALLTLAAQRVQNWGSGTHVPVLLVDAGLMIGLYVLAMKSRRYWPIWVAGLHLITLSTHLATLATPNYAFKVYFGLATLWAIPELLVIAFGVELDRRAGVGRHELEPAHRTKHSR